jgi:hypothetical protein
MGYTNIREYKEGKRDWQQAGLPMGGEGTSGDRKVA